jgi:hypothetical protein
MATTEYLMLASGYPIDRPAYEMAKQTIKHSQLWRDFYAAWVKRENAWRSYRDGETDKAAYDYYNGFYYGIREGVIDVFGKNTFIDTLRVFEDIKGFRIQ